MAPDSPARTGFGRWFPFVLAAAVPALLAGLFWRTTPPVGGYAQRPPSGAPSASSVAPEAQAAPDAAGLYARNCASCHGADLGGTPAGVALRRPDWPYSNNRELLVRVLYEGRGLRMPSFGGRLSQQQITALAAWLQAANGAPAAK